MSKRKRFNSLANLRHDGRPKGSVNKFTELKDASLEAFDRLDGVDGLVKWAERSNDNRGHFYQMITKLLPKDIILGSDPDNPVNFIFNNVKRLPKGDKKK